MCGHLPPQLKAECTEFIDDNIETLIKKLAENYPPEQICIFLRLCTPKEEILIYALGSKRSGINIGNIYLIEYEKKNQILTKPFSLIATNEIEDNTINGVETEYEVLSPECLLCEQLIREVEKKASSDKSRVRITITNTTNILFILCFLFKGSH